MSWFGKSKAKQEAEKTAIQALQDEVDRLQAENAETARSRAEWQASAESATNERDAVRAETEESISQARLRHADAISDLHHKFAELDSNLADERKKHALLDEANLKMADMLRERDQQLEQTQKSSATALLDRNTTIHQLEQKLRELHAENSVNSTRLSEQISDLKQQLDTTRQQLDSAQQQLNTAQKQLEETYQQREAAQKQADEAKEQLAVANRQLTVGNESMSTRIVQLEQRLTTEAAQAVSRIAELEQKLAESEVRSANRAEQRSALLRNMVEIHRLSAVSSKNETSSESLKLMNPGWSEQNESESA